jgi:hypothetical protein
MSLEHWLQNDYLIKHQATVAEVQKLLRLVDRELSDAAVPGLSNDGAFMHAYDAALQLCALALRVGGYTVAKGKGHHAYTINSLQYTLGQPQATNTIYLSKCSTLRNHSLYDHADVISDQDAQELLETVRQLRTDILSWLRVNHFNLLPPGY